MKHLTPFGNEFGCGTLGSRSPQPILAKSLDDRLSKHCFPAVPKLAVGRHFYQESWILQSRAYTISWTARLYPDTLRMNDLVYSHTITLQVKLED